MGQTYLYSGFFTHSSIRNRYLCEFSRSMHYLVKPRIGVEPD